MTSRLSQFVQTLRKSSRRPRSRLGRFTERWRTVSCWRSARFSGANERRVLKAEMSERSNDQIMLGQ